MAGVTGNSQSAAVWQASGEATPSAPLPEQYVPTVRSTNALHSAQAMPPDWNGNVRRQPIVQRAQRTVGMKYMYVRGQTRMPIHPLGADGTPVPWDSSFQPNIFGLIHNAGFNNALFQAGYPGYNLGISFKVQNINDAAQTAPSTGRSGLQRTSTGPKSNKGGSRGTQPISRGLGRRTT
jgi:hypothetical protein